MKIFLIVLITVVLMTAAFVGIVKYNPGMLAKIKLDSLGFPMIKKEGDQFLKNGILYVVKGGEWIIYNTTGTTERVINIVVKDDRDNIYDVNGRAFGIVNGNIVQIRKTNCPSNCLKAYPSGSQYYGYYYCAKGCGAL